MKKKHIVIIVALALVLGLLLSVCAALERKTVPQKEQNNEPGIGAVNENENEEPNDPLDTEDNREEDPGNTETNGVEDDTTEGATTEFPVTNPPATNPPATEPPATEPPTTETPNTDSGVVLPEDEFD